MRKLLTLTLARSGGGGEDEDSGSSCQPRPPICTLNNVVLPKNLYGDNLLTPHFLNHAIKDLI